MYCRRGCGCRKGMAARWGQRNDHTRKEEKRRTTMRRLLLSRLLLYQPTNEMTKMNEPVTK